MRDRIGQSYIPGVLLASYHSKDGGPFFSSYVFGLAE